jgi:drug/metabolite transporter (DMT)-like permease
MSIVLSVAGLSGVMFFHPAFGHSYTMTGIAIVIIYGFIWGLYGVSVKIVFRDIDSRIGFSVVSIYTVIALFILTMFMGQPQQMFTMPFSGWAVTVVSGVTGIALGHVFYYSSIRHLGSTTPSLVQLAQPFIVLVVSYFIFSESLSVFQWIFGIALVAGSALAIVAEKEVATLPI